MYSQTLFFTMALPTFFGGALFCGICLLEELRHFLKVHVQKKKDR